MIDRQIDSPMPRPLDFVVKNGMKIRSVTSLVKADTAIRHGEEQAPSPSSSAWLERIASSRGRSTLACMASIPFMSRLIRTCWSWIRSPQILGRPDANSIRTDTALVASSRRTRATASLTTWLMSSWNHLDLGLLRQRPDPADHLAGPVGVLDDPFRGTACSRQIGGLAAEPADAGVRIGDHGGERLGDFMGNRGGEFAERRHARDMRELGLRLAQRLFGLFGTDRRRHVAADAAIAEETATCIMEAACRWCVHRSG